MNVMARVAALLCLGSHGRHQIGSVRTFIQRSDERGGAAVEMALCLPILLMIVTGIFSFGIALNNYIMLTNSIEVGGRQLALLRGQTLDPCKDVSNTIAAASPMLKSANLSYTFNLNGASYTGVNGKSCTGGVGQLSQNMPMTVTVTYPCTLLIYARNVLPGCTLTAQVTELEQ